MITLVPFKKRTYADCLLLADLNSGATMCKKMGLNPIGVVLGQKDREDMKGFAYNTFNTQANLNLPTFRSLRFYRAGLRGTVSMMKRWGIPVTFCSAEREMTFLCEPK